MQPRGQTTKMIGGKSFVSLLSEQTLNLQGNSQVIEENHQKLGNKNAKPSER